MQLKLWFLKHFELIETKVAFFVCFSYWGRKELLPAGWRPESQIWEMIWLGTGRFLGAVFRWMTNPSIGVSVTLWAAVGLVLGKGLSRAARCRTGQSCPSIVPLPGELLSPTLSFTAMPNLWVRMERSHRDTWNSSGNKNTLLKMLCFVFFPGCAQPCGKQWVYVFINWARRNKTGDPEHSSWFKSSGVSSGLQVCALEESRVLQLLIVYHFALHSFYKTNYSHK